VGIVEELVEIWPNEVCDTFVLQMLLSLKVAKPPVVAMQNPENHHME